MKKVFSLAIVALAFVLAFALPARADGQADLRAAYAAATAGRAEEAIGLFTKALASIDLSVNDRAEALTTRGNIRDDLGRSELALADYDAAIALKSDYYWAYYNRGVLHVKRGEYPQAFADYEKSIALKPDYAPAYQARGNAYDDTGEFLKAMADYDRAIALRQDEPTAYDDRGVAEAGQALYTAALPDFDRAIELNPQYGKAYSDRGHVEYQMGQFDKALTDFGLALRYRPDYPYALRGRGATYFLLGRFAEADADFSRIASRMREPYPLMWLYLVRSTAHSTSAGATAAALARLGNNHPYAALAGVFGGTVTPDAALALARKAEAGERGNLCAANFFIGEAYVTRGNRAAARPFFEAARTGCGGMSLEREAAAVELSRS